MVVVVVVVVGPGASSFEQSGHARMSEQSREPAQSMLFASRGHRPRRCRGERSTCVSATTQLIHTNYDPALTAITWAAIFRFQVCGLPFPNPVPISATERFNLMD